MNQSSDETQPGSLSSEPTAVAARVQATDTCPCASGKTFVECCQPVIAGKRQAQTASELLRARYSAFVSADIDFIVETHHPSTRDQVTRESIEEWSTGSEWRGLEIHSEDDGDDADTSIIMFTVRYDVDGVPQEHFERSIFHRDGGSWFFLNSDEGKQETIRREEPKVGRNEPCPCGSGKKYKRCHGA